MPIGPQQSQTAPTLMDFNANAGQANQLSDFAPDPNAVAPVTNDASNRNMAAHAALLSGDPNNVIQAYAQTKAELSQTGQSDQAEQIFDQARQQSFEAAKPVLNTMLADQTIPLPDKQNALVGVYNENSAMYRTDNLLSSKMLQAPSSNNSEAEDVRFSAADVMNSINETKRQQQIMVNAAIANSGINNEGTANKVEDIGGMALPFSNQKNVADIGEQFGGGIMDRVRAIFAPGQETDVIRNRLLNMDPADRIQATSDLINIINSNSGIVMQSTNDYRKVQDLQKFISGDGYTSDDKWADDFSAVADLATGLGGAAKDAVGAIKAARASAAEEAAFKASAQADNDAFNAWKASGGKGPQPKPSSGGATFSQDWNNPLPRQNLITDTTQPASPAMNIKDTNPRMYQNIHEAAASDPTGEVAKALYGTNADDALFNDLAPEPATADGSVKAKVATPDQLNNQQITPTPELKHYANTDGAIYYTDAEKAAQSSRVVNDFQQAIGMTDRKEMFQILHLDNDVNGNTVRVKAVYGPQDSGFSNPDDAMDMAKWTLRKYGVDESNIQLLQRVGGDYVPVNYTPGMGENAPTPRTQFNNDPGFKDYSNANSLDDINIQNDAVQGHAAQATTTSGQNVNLTGVIRPGGADREVHAFDDNGNRLGSMVYSQDGSTNPNVRVNPENQRQGIATAMYDYAEKHGAVIPDVNSQVGLRSKAGQAFREARAGGAGGGLPDYLVQVNHDYKMNPANQEDWDHLSVKNNFWMRSGAFAGSSHEGSLQSMLTNITSVLHPTITMGFSKNVLKEGNIEKELFKLAHDRFASIYNKLPSEGKRRVEDLLLKQNSMGYEASPSEMRSLGMTNDEQNAVLGFRQVWDQMYYLENMDHTKTLINKGYKKFIDDANDTMLYARPISRGAAGNSLRVWNHLTDNPETWGKTELDELYERGGTIAELRSPFSLGDEMATHVASPESKDGGYLRGLKPDDTTLNYRRGYFHVQYKDPHFIVKVQKDLNGNVLYHKAIATAKTSRDADILVKRLQKTDAMNGYYHRPDMHHMTGDRSNRRFSEYDIATAQGRSPQRVRGRRLEDTSQQSTDPEFMNMVSPTQSLLNSARSIARRTAMRDPLDAAKYRFVNQYGKYLPGAETGNPRLPTNVSDVKYRGNSGQYDSKDLAAARTTFNYIDYMEHGYENHFEDAYDGLMKGTADILAGKSIEYDSKLLAKGEQYARLLAAHNSPIEKLEGLAYSIYIAANPIPQMLMHGHQALNLLALHPGYFATPKPYASAMWLLAKHLGLDSSSPAGQIFAKGLAKGMGSSVQDMEAMWDQWQKSGITSAIDKHLLVRSGLRTVADQMNKKPLAVAARTAAYPFYLMRKVGFDAGEFYTQMMGWLTHRDMAQRSGEDLNKADVQDWITAKTTNFTGNFNRSGDMAYQHNSISMLMQFFQWSHKALGLATGNRILSTSQKIRLIGNTLALYGVPLGAGGMYLMDRILGDKAPQDQKTRDALQGGIIGAAYSAALSYAFDGGKHDRVDFEKLSPYDVMGMGDHIAEIMNGKLGSVFADSPASVVFGGSPAIANFWKAVARYTHLMPDSPDNPTKLSEVGVDFLKSFPGLSNAFKAAYAWELHKKINAYTGKVEDTNITTGEAIAAAAGLPTLNETNGAFDMSRYMADKQLVTKDFNLWYDDYKTRVLSTGADPTSVNYALQMSNEYFRVVGNDNAYIRGLFNQRLKQDAEQGDIRLIKQAFTTAHMAQSGVRFGSYDEARAIVNEFPNVTPEQRQTYLNIINTIQANSNGKKLPTSVVDRFLDKGE